MITTPNFINDYICDKQAYFNNACKVVDNINTLKKMIENEKNENSNLKTELQESSLSLTRVKGDIDTIKSKIININQVENELNILEKKISENKEVLLSLNKKAKDSRYITADETLDPNIEKNIKKIDKFIHICILYTNLVK